MKSFFNVPVIVYFVSLLGFVKHASSILCYDCNSLFDPRCGTPFDPFSLGIVNCSLRDPPDHLPDALPALCRTVKMDIYGKVRVVRGCGYITDAAVDDQPCQRKANSDQLFLTYCSCTTDLCNNAGSTGGSAFAAVVAVLTFVLAR